MNNDRRPSSNHEWCPPPTSDPAKQPHPPADCDDCKDCEPPKSKDPPKLDKPNECPPADCDCKCPSKKTPPPNCLEKASKRQNHIIAAGDKAKAYKTYLDTYQKSTTAGALAYTRDTYNKLVKQWEQQDRDIAELIRKLVCAVPCWKCIIDCYVCPIIDELHNLEKWLNGTNALYDTVDNLYDLQYWRARDRSIKDARLNRIKAVLDVWDTPAQKIGAILVNDQALIDSANKALGTAPGLVVYDVFLNLVPMHLAVAPPTTSGRTTKIDEAYTGLCDCDKGSPDTCCGPDVGPPSLVQRLIGPQPYLVDPDKYFKLICCLVECRFEPAREALMKAEADAADVDANITAITNQLKPDALKALVTGAKGSIPSVIDCCDYEKDGDDDDRDRDHDRSSPRPR